jgi:hypothetical protein
MAAKKTKALPKALYAWILPSEVNDLEVTMGLYTTMEKAETNLKEYLEDFDSSRNIDDGPPMLVEIRFIKKAKIMKAKTTVTFEAI